MKNSAAVRSDLLDGSSRDRSRSGGRWKTTGTIPTFLAIAVLFLSSAASGQNIVIVVIDDVGVERLNTYDAALGGESNPATTPTIDSIAEDGVQFNNFWAYPICSPFRASMLTGVGPWEHGVGGVLTPSSSQGLDPGRMTIARMLKNANPSYRTEAIGKWHVAANDDSALVARHPIDSGFDRFNGGLFNPGEKISTTAGSPRGYTAWQRCEGTTATPPTPENCEIETTYSTTYITEEAIRCINGSEPFFCYVAYNAAHIPFHDPLGPQPSDSQCDVNDLTKLSSCHKAMTEALDTELDKLFFSGSPNGPPIDFHDTTLILVSDNGTMESAAVRNGPYPKDHSKRTVYQGGVNTPLIVKGEAVTLDTSGEPIVTVDALVQATDIFATVAEIASSEQTLIDNDITDSRSLGPYLRGEVPNDRRTTVTTEMFLPTGLSTTESPPEPDPDLKQKWLRSSRDRCYKLIWNFEKGFFTAEAYNLCNDKFEEALLDPDDPAELPPDIHRTLLAAIRDPQANQDWDNDGIDNSIDNCQTVSNPAQDDSDGDGCGNVCDADYDQNNVVGFVDLIEFIANFGCPGSGNPNPSCTCTGAECEKYMHADPISVLVRSTGYPDFHHSPLIWNFGGKPGPSGTTIVSCPEPPSE